VGDGLVSVGLSVCLLACWLDQLKQVLLCRMKQGKLANDVWCGESIELARSCGRMGWAGWAHLVGWLVGGLAWACLLFGNGTRFKFVRGVHFDIPTPCS
jgi:hypothetical protein